MQDSYNIRYRILKHSHQIPHFLSHQVQQFGRELLKICSCSCSGCGSGCGYWRFCSAGGSGYCYHRLVVCYKIIKKIYLGTV